MFAPHPRVSTSRLQIGADRLAFAFSGLLHSVEDNISRSGLIQAVKDGEISRARACGASISYMPTIYT